MVRRSTEDMSVLSSRKRAVIIFAVVLLLLGIMAMQPPVDSYAAPTRFTLSQATYPTALKQGTSFSLRGTLTGVNTITKVEVGVAASSSGAYLNGFYYVKSGLNGKSFSISNADSSLKFGNLSPGSYYYRITAYDGQGSEVVLNQPFTVSGTQTTAATGTWKREGGAWYYYYQNGSKATNGWVHDGKGWCWLDGDGKLVTNRWFMYKDVWYYLKSSGYMAANEWAKASKGWCWMNSDGRLAVSKWVWYKDFWYYIKDDGYMAADGWANDGKGWFWTDSEGRLQTSAWVNSNGAWYYMQPSGYMAANRWINDGRGWCWMEKSGRMAANRWVKTGGQWYYLKSSGYMAVGQWFHDGVGWCRADNDGLLMTNCWFKSNGVWYYFKSSGYMAANEWIKDNAGWWYWIDAEGHYLTNAWIGNADEWYYMGSNGHIAKGPLGFDDYLDQAGFPDSYKPALQQLHKTHPKWVFYADATGVSWNDLMTKQKVVGRNLVEPTSSASYINQAYVGSSFDGRWKQASDAAIAYYLDPRNFLTESGIFQFLDQRSAYNPGTKEQIEILVSSNSCFMNTDDYISWIYNAGKNSGVNPCVLTAMVIMEQGWRGTSDLISGTNSSYPGIYNHFNVGAYTAGGMNAITRGLWWASGAGSGATSFGRPWNTVEKSLTGGAAHYKSGYIDNNQYTYYTKKFNVMNGTSEVGTHQYMTNVDGAYYEGAIAKGAYVNDNTRVVFRIPVFNNLPSKACPKP